MILTGQKKTVLFTYQNGKMRNDGSKIMFGSKNTQPKHKIRMWFYISEIAKWLDNFSRYLQFRIKKLVILGVVINIISVL